MWAAVASFAVSLLNPSHQSEYSSLGDEGVLMMWVGNGNPSVYI